MFKNKKWITVLLLAMMVGLAFVPTISFAQSNWDSAFGAQNTSDKDIAVNTFLKPLFGRIVPGGSSGSETNPLEELLGIFNSSVLILGGILLAYTLIAGTLSTAHDGEMLGKRWSSIWVPIRTVIGAAAILPVNGGYAVIQMLVMWLALQGVNMANSMWVGFISKQDPVSQAFYVPPNATRQIREVMNDMFLSNVCTVAMKETQSLVGGIAATAIGMNPIGAEVNSIPIPGISGFMYGPSGIGCGRVAWINRDTASADSANSFFESGSPASVAALVDAKKLNQALNPVHDANMQAAQTKLKALAEKLVIQKNLTDEELSAAITSIVDTYSKQLHDKALEAYNSQRAQIQQNVIKGMKQDGFALAGMYYLAIIRAQDEVTRAISQTPATSRGPLQSYSDLALGAINPATGGAGGALVSMVQGAYVNSGESGKLMKISDDMVKKSNSSGTTSAQNIGEEGANRSWVMKLVSWFMNDDLTALGNQKYSQVNQNPIIMAKNLGENMTAGAWSALLLGGSVLALSGLGAGVAGDWATVFSPVLFSLFALLVVPGATLSTYVPMIPFILWVGVMIGWLILVVEAVIGSVIWAVSHLAPDGDGVVGRGGQGYMLVLSLVLRPPLMILGLAASISLMKPLGLFLNTSFLAAFGIAVNPGPLGLTQAIAGCVLYAVVMVSVINRVFTLIHVVPDKILRWIGGGGNELGTEATSMEQFTTGQTVAAVGATRQLGELTKGIGQGARDINQRQANKANTDMLKAEENRSRQAQVDANKDDSAHRQGLTASAATTEANRSGTPEARGEAAHQNEMARNSRLDQAESNLDHFFNQSGAGGFNDVANMSKEEQGTLAASSPEMAKAVDFANNLQAAKADANGPGMQKFLAANRTAVRNDSVGAKSWEKAASQAYGYESTRQQLLQPNPTPKPKGGDNDD